MSSAFTKESDNQNLNDITPTLNALIFYLTRENNGVRIYETKNYINSEGRTVHEMNNGLAYVINASHEWVVV